MRLSSVISIALIILSILSCKKSDVIPEKDMVKILTKIYLTDGTISVSTKSELSRKDTIAYYEPILEHYGYTTNQFDSSIIYYSKKTEILDRIFDNVIMQLTILRDREAKENESIEVKLDTLRESENIWPLKTSWNMAIDYPNNPSLGFEIPTHEIGIYTISFDAQIYPDDEAVNARHYIFFYFDNNTPIGARENSKIFTYIKDGKRHHFSYKFILKNTQVTHLKGWLYDTGNQNSSFKRDAKFYNITVTFKPFTKTTEKSVQPLKKRAIKSYKKIKVKEIDR